MKPNRYTSHPSAFISSTFVDLKEERACVANVLQSRGLLVNALETKPASSESSKQEILSGIQESDFVILIIGDRYGSILPAMTGSKTLSITWWEYQQAKLLGKPVLPYYKSNPAGHAHEHDDQSDPSYKLKRTMFQKFKEHISSNLNPSYFDDCSDLAIKIDRSIIAVYRSAVINLMNKNEELADSNKKLSEEIERLNRSTHQNLLQHNLFHEAGLLGSITDSKSLTNPLFDAFKSYQNKM